MTDHDPHAPQRRSLRPGASEEVPTAPQRRSLVPPSQEIPVSQPGVYEPGYETDAGAGAEPGSGEWPTEVMPAADATYAEPGYEAFEPAPDASPTAPQHEASAERPWFKAPWFIGVAAGLGVVLVGGGIAWGVIAAGGAEAVAASETPSPTASPVPSPEPGIVTLLDDGIADDEYPPLAAPVGDGYPAAYEMQDWVWEKVGPGWALVSLGVGKANYDESYDGDVSAPDALYLASPEGALFELATLPSSSDQVRVRSWLEDDHKVRLTTQSPWGDGPNDGGHLLDLDTGEIADMAFTVGGKESWYEDFVASSATNTELWAAVGDYDTSTWQQPSKLTWWSEAAGWSDAQAAGANPWARGASPNGEWVVVELYSTGDSKLATRDSGPPGEPVLVRLNLSTMTSETIRPSYRQLSEPWCNVIGVTDDGAPLLWCYANETEAAYEVTANGTVQSYDGSVQQSIWDQRTVSSPDGSVTATSATQDESIYDLRVTVDGEEVVVARSGEGMPLNGLRYPAFKPAGEGLTLVTSYNGCMLVDTVNGYASSLVQADNYDVVNCVGYGIGSS